MGAENSRPARERDDYFNRNNTDAVIQRALERQRQLFEQKCDMLIQSQATNYPTSPTTQNVNYKSHSPPPMPASTSNALYPNIQECRLYENRQSLQGYIPPPSVSTLHEFQFSSAVPSAPPESPESDYVEVKRVNQPTKNKGAIPKYRGNKPRQPNNNNNKNMGCVSCSGAYGMYIYQCQNGHSSCMKCKSTHKPCGICSKPITDMRNITLETLIADMGITANDNQELMKCLNTKDGCSLSFTKETMADHLKECPFMELECPLSKIFGICQWKGKVNHLSVHFNDMHPEHCIAEVGKQMTLLDTTTESIIVYFIKIGSFNFLFYIKRDKEQTIHMTAQLFGSKVSASKWTYEVQVYDKKKPKRKFTYVDVCNSFSIPVEDIFSKGQCAIIKQQYASTFFNNNLLTYEIFLKKEPNKRYRIPKTQQSVNE